MRYAVLFGLIGTLAVLFAVPAIMPAQAIASTDAVAASDQETPPPPPKGVSGATPDIKPPAMDNWVCPNCGAESPQHKRRYKKGHGAPQLGAQAGHRGGSQYGGGQRGGGHWGGHGDGFCGPRQGRGHEFGQGDGRCGPGMGQGHGKGHGAFAGHGPRSGVAAERMLRHANKLDLTDDQIAKLEMLSFEAKKKLIDLHASIEKEQLELKNRIRSDAEDMTQIKRHLSAISNARTGIQEVKIANLFAARKILTDEQKKLVKEAHPRMGMIVD
jgi:Spy/CpxP family protein refolding chaperone